MLEKQVRCFTCQSVINPKLFKYEAYRRDLGLSRSDAADKAQLINMCCRTTAFSQTGAEERMYAAGRLETVGGVKVIHEVYDYPEIKSQRVEGEGPFKRNDITYAPNLGKIESFRSYGGLNPGIKKVPARTVVGFSFPPPEPKVFKRTNKLSLINDISSFPNKNWTLADVGSFPSRDDYETPFTSREVKIAIKAPLIDHTIEVTLEAQVTTKVALERLRDAVMEVRPDIYDLAIRSPEVLSRPDVLDIVLKDHRHGHGISLFELNKGSLVVKKVSFRRETQVYTFEFEATEGRFRVAETDLAAGKMGISLIEDATEAKIMSKVRQRPIRSVELVGQQVLVTLEKAELSFEAFEVRTGEKISEELEAIPVGAKIVGAKSLPDVLLLTLKKDQNVAVLAITGHFDLKSHGDITDQMKEDLAFKQAFAAAFDL